ncbi:MAG: peptidase [Methanobacterium sp.]
MDLEPGWEKKALIILGIITFIVVIYAYGPFKSDPNVQIQNQTVEAAAPTPAPAPASPVVTTNNSSSNNITNVTPAGNNGTYLITSDQAKQIATQSGFTAGQPTKGSVMVNNNNMAVWIVPLMKGTILSKRVYVDAATGIIVGSEEVKI